VQGDAGHPGSQCGRPQKINRKNAGLRRRIGTRGRRPKIKAIMPFFDKKARCNMYVHVCTALYVHVHMCTMTFLQVKAFLR
jgi:hypothetical protein